MIIPQGLILFIPTGVNLVADIGRAKLLGGELGSTVSMIRRLTMRS